MGALRTGYDALLFDLDGVVYIGASAVPGAAEAIASARAGGQRIVFVTNNASRPAGVIAAHLTELGVSAQADDVTTSAQVASAILRERLGEGAKVLVVGGEGLYSALTEAGMLGVASIDDDPVAVVQGFTPDLTWRLLAEGARAINAGLLWVATNLDSTFPAPWGPAPGNGSLVAALRHCTGQEPAVVAGKPSAEVFRQTLIRYGAKRALVIGDRLDTDIQGAVAAGLDSLLVFTGVNGARDVLAAPAEQRPTHLAEDLRGLEAVHPEVVRTGERTWVCEKSEVELRQGELYPQCEVTDPMDLLRAACAAAWAQPEPVNPEPVLQALRTLRPGAAWTR